MRELDLTLLRCLLAVHQHGTYAAAATSLHRTQAAVTQQMLRLQEQVGVTLFERHGRKNKLTQHGEMLLDYAKHMLAINDEALRRLHENDLSGSLRIGAPHDVASSILPSLLATIARSSPLLRLEIDVGRSPFLMESLRCGKLDLIISTRFDPSLEGITLRTSPTVWLCATDYVHNPKATIPLILADEPSLFRHIAIDALNKVNLPWSLAYSALNLIGINSALQARLGITARSIEMLSNNLRILDETDGLPPLPDVSYYLWMRKDVLNPLTRKVYEIIKNNLEPSAF